MSHEAHIATLQTKIDSLNAIITKVTAQKSWVDGLSVSTVSEFNTARASASTDVSDRIRELSESDSVTDAVSFLSTALADNLTSLNTELSLYQSDKAELEKKDAGTWTEADAAWQANPTWRSGS